MDHTSAARVVELNRIKGALEQENWLLQRQMEDDRRRRRGYKPQKSYNEEILSDFRTLDEICDEWDVPPPRNNRQDSKTRKQRDRQKSKAARAAQQQAVSDRLATPTKLLPKKINQSEKNKKFTKEEARKQVHLPFKAEDDSKELSVKKGDLVMVLDTLPSKWVLVQFNDQLGWIPNWALEKLDLPQKQKQRPHSPYHNMSGKGLSLNESKAYSNDTEQGSQPTSSGVYDQHSLSPSLQKSKKQLHNRSSKALLSSKASLYNLECSVSGMKKTGIENTTLSGDALRQLTAALEDAHTLRESFSPASSWARGNNGSKAGHNENARRRKGSLGSDSGTTTSSVESVHDLTEVDYHLGPKKKRDINRNNSKSRSHLGMEVTQDGILAQFKQLLAQQNSASFQRDYPVTINLSLLENAIKELKTATSESYGRLDTLSSETIRPPRAGGYLWRHTKHRLFCLSLMQFAVKKRQVSKYVVKCQSIGIFLFVVRRQKERIRRTKLFLYGIVGGLKYRQVIDKIHCKTYSLGILARLGNLSKSLKMNERLARLKKLQKEEKKRAKQREEGPKMVRLQWQAVQIDKISGSVFDEELSAVSDTEEEPDDDEFRLVSGLSTRLHSIASAVHSQFRLESTKKEVAAPKTGSKLSKPKVMEIFPTDVSRNMAIQLKRAIGKRKLDDIYNSIEKLDFEDIGGADVVETLLQLRCFHDPSLVELVRNANTPVEKLPLPERFVYKIVIPDKTVYQKLRVMQSIALFDNHVQEVNARCDLLVRCCEELKNSSCLKTLLTGVILKLANIVHEGSRNARAGGFKLTSLPQLMQTKSPNGFTFGRVLIEGLLSVAPELLQIKEELPAICSAQPHEVSMVTTNEMKTVVKELTNQAKSASEVFEREGCRDGILNQTNEFVRRATLALRSAENNVTRTRGIYFSTCHYFLESPSELDADALLKQVQAFLSLFSAELQQATFRQSRHIKSDRSTHELHHEKREQAIDQPQRKPIQSSKHTARKPPPPAEPKPRRAASYKEPTKQTRHVAFSETAPELSQQRERYTLGSRTMSVAQLKSAKNSSHLRRHDSMSLMKSSKKASLLSRHDSMSLIPSDVRSRGQALGVAQAKHIDRPRHEVMEDLMSFFEKSQSNQVDKK